MADLQTKTFGQLVQQQAAAVQARASGLIDFTVGSVARALVEAVAGVGLWLQALVIHVLTLTRLSTSVGADADSWIADFGGPYEEGGVAAFARLGATAATGDLIFSRFSTTGSATVLVGSTVQTPDGSQRVVVTLNPAHGDYDAVLGGYVMGPGDASITVPAASVSLGQAANVLAGTLTVISSPIVGVDTVTNAAPFVGGSDPETDAAFRLRFRGYLQSLREGTPAAVLYHVRNLNPGVSATLVEFEEISGTPHTAFFHVVADDGTGAADAEFITAISAAVDAHRAAGIEYAVHAAAGQNITIAGAIAEILPDAVEAYIITLVEAALSAHIEALGIGDDVVFSRLYQVAYDASPDLVKINLTLNGGTSDVVISPVQVAKLASVTVT